MFCRQPNLNAEEIKQLPLQQLHDGQPERGGLRDLNLPDTNTEEEHGDQEHSAGAGESQG